MGTRGINVFANIAADFDFGTDNSFSGLTTTIPVYVYTKNLTSFL